MHGHSTWVINKIYKQINSSSLIARIFIKTNEHRGALTLAHISYLFVIFFFNKNKKKWSFPQLSEVNVLNLEHEW